MYATITNPIFESNNLVSCRCQSEPMNYGQAKKISDFVSWNNTGDEVWILNLASGELTPPDGDHMEVDEEYDDF